MSAYYDAQTTGGYGEGYSSSGSSSGGWLDALGQAAVNGINRWVDVETWRNTGGQMPPNYYAQGQGVNRSQSINTGTIMQGGGAQSLLSNPLVLIGAGVLLFLALRK